MDHYLGFCVLPCMHASWHYIFPCVSVCQDWSGGFRLVHASMFSLAVQPAKFQCPSCIQHAALQVYILKARHVPQTKLHEKLIQATHVIIALVREKEQLTNHVNSLLERNNHIQRDDVGTVHQSTQTLAGSVGLKVSSPLRPQSPSRLQERMGHASCNESLEKSALQDENSSGSDHDLSGEECLRATAL